jgi:HD-GYP domain-containing protein (c-di-GMP phosphodiesterase class II)
MDGIAGTAIKSRPEPSNRAVEYDRLRISLESALEQDIREDIGFHRTLSLFDSRTQGHLRRVGHLLANFAPAFGFSPAEVAEFHKGALLHDLGKLMVSKAIIDKPTALSDPERHAIEQHPGLGDEMLAPFTLSDPVRAIVLFHHERWDGNGYPYRLAGSQIPFSSRMTAVVDVYDALTHDRPYRRAWEMSRVEAFLVENGGTMFDDMLVQAFLEFITHVPSRFSRPHRTRTRTSYAYGSF